MSESVKNKAFKASLWRFGEVAGRQLVSLFVTTVIARLVLPAQYGLVAMVTVFVSISEVFIDSGFSTALIRDNNRSRLDCSTVFYFNMVVAVFFCLLFQFAAPLIADFYKMPELTAITRVVSLSLILSGFSAVQTSLLSAELNFKKITNVNLISLIISGIVGIILAYRGFQVWALVIQTLLSRTIAAILFWTRSKWYPAWEFSKASLKRYFSFGVGLLGSALVNTVYNNSFALIIGKVFSSADLAFYNRGYNFANTASAVPTGIVESVSFPALCKLQDDTARLRDGYSRLIRLAAFVVFPLCLGLGAVAYPFINVLLTERWLYAAELMQIIVFCMMWYPIHSLNLNLLKVSGKGGLFFKLEIWKKAVGIIILCITVPLGLKAICYGSIVSSILCLVINTHYTGKIIHFGFWRQMLDLLPALLLSLAMFAVVAIVTKLLGNGGVSLFAGIATGIVIYTAGAFLFRFPQLKEVKGLIKRKN